MLAILGVGISSSIVRFIANGRGREGGMCGRGLFLRKLPRLCAC